MEDFGCENLDEDVSRLEGVRLASEFELVKETRGLLLQVEPDESGA